MPVKYVMIDDDREGQRLDNYLVGLFKGVPKSRIYKAIRRGEVRVNSSRVTPYYRLQLHDKIRLPPMHVDTEQPRLPSSGKLSQLLEKHIVLENEDIIVLDKPSGVVVHSSDGLGVQQALRQGRPKLKCLELVHRLDKGTSGCLVLAKKRSVLRLLQERFRHRKVGKQYLALLKGRLSKPITVNKPLSRRYLPEGGRVVVVDHQHGKEAVTHFTPISVGDQATLAKVTIETGRTHQIRVHAASIQHPVAGDERYGNEKFNIFVKSVGLCRMFLHAQRLVVMDYPAAGENLALQVNLSVSLLRILSELGLNVDP